MTLADTTAIKFGTGQIGIYYLADTDQPAPFALMLHGIPGSEKHHDLAYHLRGLGWHVLVLHFAGAWGSAGEYTPQNHPQEARAALDFVLSPAAPRAIDPSKIAVIGFSLGSRAALLAAAEDARITTVVSMGGICDFTEIMWVDEFYAMAAQFLQVADVPTLKEKIAQFGVGLQPYEALPAIAPRPVLLLHATDDEIVPFYHLKGFGVHSHVTRVPIQGANHIFALHRTELMQAVSRFLSNL